MSEHEKGSDIYESAWFSAEWKDKKQMLRDARRAFLRGDHSLIALASDYYSAAGTAGAKNGAIWKVRSLWCGGIALAIGYIVYMRGLSSRSVNELDIVQSIFRAAGYGEKALECIEEALSRELPFHHHTPALLLLSKAQILAQRGQRNEARTITEENALQRQIEDTPQRVRVLKNAAIVGKLIGSEDMCRTQKLRARRLANEYGVLDQLAKIEAIDCSS